MKKLIFTLIVVFIAFNLNSQTQVGGSVGITAISGSSTSWTNSSDAVIDDNTRASSTSTLSSIGNYTDYIVITNFGFSVPSGNLVEGIVVNVDRRSSSHTSAIADNSIRLVKNGIIVGDDKAYGGPWANYDINRSYGGAADLWGTTWDPADINNSNFGVAISAKLLFGTAGFSEIDNVTITISSTAPLPVELSFFKAEAALEGVSLKWQTTAEVQNDFFEVQKSTNGIDFDVIGIVNGNGNSVEVNNYSFYDINFKNGAAYYRLRQVDFDGTFEYSEIELVKSGDVKANISLFPNPATSEFNFVGLGEGPSIVQIFSNNGELVKAVTINFNEPVSISDLSPGAYFVKGINSAGIYNQKLVVK